MFIRKITRSAGGEVTIRIPKMLVWDMAIKGDFVAIHQQDEYLILEPLDRRLSKLQEGRLLDRKRLTPKGKAT